MRRKFYFVIVSLILFSFIGNSQIMRKRYYKPAKKRKLVPAIRTNYNPFFSQGNIFFTSNNRNLTAHFILKNTNSNGPVISNAKVYVNGRIIKPSNIMGEYRGLAPVLINNYGKYPLNIKIITPDKRVLTSNRIINSTLKMNISNIFPRQPNKIDVGTDVIISWYFTPRANLPVTLTLTNINNNFKIFRRVIRGNRIRLRSKMIPRRKTIRFKVSAPLIRLKYNQKVSPGSSLTVHIKDVKVLQTFG